MAETEGNASPMEQEMDTDSPSRGKEGKPASYKESLLGFNGVDNTGGYPEEEELLSDVFGKEWELPELTEEVKELMKEYPVVPINPEEYSEWCRPWNTTLIITILGRKYNVYTLKYHLGRLWGFAEFDLIDLPNNNFIVKFLEKDGWIERYKKVLYGGPWVVQHQCLVVQQWSANFDPFTNQPKKVISWVRIPNIPLECYTKNFITRLGNRIGKTFRVDMNTLSESQAVGPKVERGRYARICVELDLQKKLVSRVIAVNSVYNVVYEGLHVFCFACGRYCHRRETCPNSCAGPVQDSNKESPEKAEQGIGTPSHTPAKTIPNVEDKFGTWMLAGNNQKSRFSKRDFAKNKADDQGRNGKGARKAKEVGHSTRFDVLGELEEEDQEDEKVQPSSDREKQPAHAPKNGQSLVIY